MHDDYPLISVCMPTRDRAAMALRAIASVLDQSYPKVELLVVDDASSDDTWRQLNARYADDSRVRLFRQASPGGACAARNRAIERARGELITDIDDDDTFLPERLSRLQAALDDSCSSVGSAYYWHYGTATRRLHATRRRVGLPELLDQNVLSHMLCRTDQLRALGGFDVTLAAFQDYDLWIRLVHRHGPALRIAEPLYRVNAGHGAPRISDSGRRLAAHRQLVDKHRSLMSARNLANQRFYRQTLADDAMGPMALLRALPDGLVTGKCRYALVRSLRPLRRWRLRYLARGVAGLIRR